MNESWTGSIQVFCSCKKPKPAVLKAIQAVRNGNGKVTTTYKKLGAYCKSCNRLIKPKELK